MVTHALATAGALVSLALAGCVQQPSFTWTGDAAADAVAAVTA
jgi:hypothetical protein